jgi:hypothetical protein
MAIFPMAAQCFHSFACGVDTDSLRQFFAWQAADKRQKLWQDLSFIVRG